MTQIIECVPNFSEGNNQQVIDQIVASIASVDKIKILNVDPGKATNRTVVTFAGDPESVLEAAFRGARKAAELIDMSRHHGEHPRFGAIDVCPLIPVSGINMEETVVYAHRLAERIGKELNIHVYCYGYAAREEKRKELSYCRSGEYEGLPAKLSQEAWKPDFGPLTFNARSGACAVGARDFLIAYNVNLNTTSTRRANSIAFDIREKGRVKRENDDPAGKIVLDDNGNQVTIPGSLKSVKAIGWYIEEFGIAQISMNLTDISMTPLHTAFDETCRKAEDRGLRVTGSEIVGLVPLESMLEAGRYFLRKQRRSTGLPDRELIRMAVKSLGLNELYPFKPEEKIIEYVMQGKSQNRLCLTDMSLQAFMEETSSESPAPGGGSVSACMAAMGIALGTMVANLSSHKSGWDNRWEYFSDWAEKGIRIQNELTGYINEDTNAFNALITAFGLPKSTPREKELRSAAIQAATQYAMEVPLKVMEAGLKAMEITEAMASEGNPSSLSDAGVGALALRSGILGAYLNVRINSGSLKNEGKKQEILTRAASIKDAATVLEKKILDQINEKI